MNDSPPPRPPPAAIPPPPRPAGSRYTWFLGVVVVLLIAYISINTALTAPNGSRGVAPGLPLPPFAVPLALSDLNGDANVATGVGQGQAGHRPACSVRGPRVLNSCELSARGPVALGMFVPAGRCPLTIDLLARVAPSFRGLQVAGVAIRGNRSDVRTLVRTHRWSFPVGYDRDGALANLYRVAVCSQITLADRRGIVQGSALLGLPTEPELRARLSALTGAPTAAVGPAPAARQP